MAKKRKRGKRGYRGTRGKGKVKSQSAAADSDDPDTYSSEIEWATQRARIRSQYCEIAKLFIKGILEPLGIAGKPEDMARGVQEFHAELEGAQAGLKLAYKSYQELTGLSHSDLMVLLAKSGSWPPPQGAAPFLTNAAFHALEVIVAQKRHNHG